jgi:replicative DNA helicase
MGLFSKKIGLGDIIEALASMSDEDKAQILSALTPTAAEETTEEAEATEEATETVEAVEEVVEAEEAEAEAEAPTEEAESTAEEATEEATEETAEGEKIDLAGIDAKINALDEVIKALAVRIENIEKGTPEEAKAEELFGLDMAEGIAADGKNEEESLRKEVFGF